MGHIKHKKKQNIFRHIQTKECVYVCETSELAESVLKLKQNGWCEAGNVISKLCAGQATKKGSVNSSAEPVGAHWGEEMAHK